MLDLTRFAPPIQDQIRPAYQAAQKRAATAAEIGRLGMLLDAYEQYGAAADCYLRAQLLDGAAFEWPYHLAVLRGTQGKHETAVVSFEEALRRRGDYVPALLGYADSLFALGRLDESEKAYRRVIGSDAGVAAAWYGLGRISAMRKDYAGAAEHYSAACKLFPAYGAAHYALALAYRQQGRDDLATIHFRAYEADRTAIPPLPDPLRAAVRSLNAGAVDHLRRAREFESEGRLDLAVTEHLSALEIDPKSVQAHVNLISLYGRLRQYTDAEREYRTALGLDPQQADIHYNYGVLLFERGDRAGAERAFRKALECHPYHAQAHHNLGFLLEQEGRLDEALAEYESALESRPDYRLAHFHAGRILAEREKYDAAIAHFSSIIDIDDESTPAYLYALAAACARAGRTANAISWARRARDGAASRGQSQLLASIEKDLRRLSAALNAAGAVR